MTLPPLTCCTHVATTADQPPPSLTSYVDGWRSQLSSNYALPPLSENISIAGDISSSEPPHHGYKRASQRPLLRGTSPSSSVEVAVVTVLALLFPVLSSQPFSLPFSSLLSLLCSHHRIPLSSPCALLFVSPCPPLLVSSRAIATAMLPAARAPCHRRSASWHASFASLSRHVTTNSS